MDPLHAAVLVREIGGRSGPGEHCDFAVGESRMVTRGNRREGDEFNDIGNKGKPFGL